MIAFRFKNRTKKMSIDRYSTVEEVLSNLQSLFQIKTRIVGFVD